MTITAFDIIDVLHEHIHKYIYTYIHTYTHTYIRSTTGGEEIHYFGI
jgi:hypothetical protein